MPRRPTLIRLALVVAGSLVAACSPTTATRPAAPVAV